MEYGCSVRCGRYDVNQNAYGALPELPTQFTWKHSLAIAGGITVVALIAGWIVSGEALGADPGWNITAR